VVGRIFGLKRDEEIRKWIRLHKEELHALYSSPNICGFSNQEERDGLTM